MIIVDKFIYNYCLQNINLIITHFFMIIYIFIIYIRMNTLVYVFVGIIVILYIIDKKEIVKPELEEFQIDKEGEK